MMSAMKASSTIKKHILCGGNNMLDCRKCKHEDCDFKEDIFNAINTIKSYTNYRVAEEIEEMIENTTESCEDFEEAN